MKKPKPAATSGPDMSKQYRKELRGLNTQLRKLARTHRTIQRDTDKAITRVLRECERQIRGLDKQAIGCERRKAILIGRLS